MTILSIAQTCGNRLQLPTISTVVGNTDNNVILLQAMMQRTALELRDEYPWPELQKEYTFLLTTDTANYALPADENRLQIATLWNRTQHWPMIGPIDPILWQQYKSGLIVSLPMQRYRVKGWGTAEFYIDPTPDSSIAGQLMVYEYITKTVFRPKTWITATAFAASSYCSYNANIYQTSAGGTTGAIPPTWLTGTQSDGVVSWTFISAAYETIIADSDEFILDPKLLIDGTVWRFLESRGLDYQGIKDIADQQKDDAKTHLIGAEALSVRGRKYGWPIIGIWSYPEGNYGI